MEAAVRAALADGGGRLQHRDLVKRLRPHLQGPSKEERRSELKAVVKAVCRVEKEAGTGERWLVLQEREPTPQGLASSIFNALQAPLMGDEDISSQDETTSQDEDAPATRSPEPLPLRSPSPILAPEDEREDEVNVPGPEAASPPQPSKETLIDDPYVPPSHDAGQGEAAEDTAEHAQAHPPSSPLPVSAAAGKASPGSDKDSPASSKTSPVADAASPSSVQSASPPPALVTTETPLLVEVEERVVMRSKGKSSPSMDSPRRWGRGKSGDVSRDSVAGPTSWAVPSEREAEWLAACGEAGTPLGRIEALGRSGGGAVLRARSWASRRTGLHWAAAAGNVPTARLVVRLCPELLWEQDAFGRTALHLACVQGKSEVATALLRDAARDLGNPAAKRLANVRDHAGRRLADYKGNALGTQLLPLKALLHQHPPPPSLLFPAYAQLPLP